MRKSSTYSEHLTSGGRDLTMLLIFSEKSVTDSMLSCCGTPISWVFAATGSPDLVKQLQECSGPKQAGVSASGSESHPDLKPNRAISAERLEVQREKTTLDYLR
jgi:hypothetical protein